jgi:hypothetical protein
MLVEIAARLTKDGVSHEAAQAANGTFETAWSSVFKPAGNPEK